LTAVDIAEVEGCTSRDLKSWERCLGAYLRSLLLGKSSKIQDQDEQGYGQELARRLHVFLLASGSFCHRELITPKCKTNKRKFKSVQALGFLNLAVIEISLANKACTRQSVRESGDSGLLALRDLIEAAHLSPIKCPSRGLSGAIHREAFEAQNRIGDMAV
jgi:hypothetical protein